MQTGNSQESGDRVLGYTSVQTGNVTLRNHIGGTDAAWLAAFGTNSPWLPIGAQVFLQPTAGVATVAGGVQIADNATTPNSGLATPFRCNNATNFIVNLSAGTLRITIVS